MEKQDVLKLPDKRLDRVLEKLTGRISEKQTLCLRALSNARKEEVQFGRFIGNHKVSVPMLEEQLYTQMRNHCSSSHCLLIEDTSKIGFSLERAIQGLGKVDKGQIQGFYLHPVLCIDAQHYGCHGIAALEFVKRPWPTQVLSHQQISMARDKTVYEQKEGYRWLSSIRKALTQCQQVPTKTVVADREADIYPLLTGLTALGVDYVIRARFDRFTQGGQTISAEVENWTQQHCYELAVPASDGRSAHRAKLAIKYGKLALKKSASRSIHAQPDYHPTYVVEVKELPESVVNGQEPIHWVLLSSHVVDTIALALQVIEWYKQRWNVEQVFRILKSNGLHIESSQVESYEKLQKLSVLALMAAVRVLQLLRARDGQTQQPMACAFNEQEQECLMLLNEQLAGKSQKLQNPYGPSSLAFAAWVIARLAGWSGYQSQRPPGPIDLLTGLQRFNERFQGYQLAKHNTT